MRTSDYVFWWAIGALVGILTALLLGCPSTPPLTPQKNADLEQTAKVIGNCQKAGRQHKSYRVYHCCMVEAGYHEDPREECKMAKEATPDAAKVE